MRNPPCQPNRIAAVMLMTLTALVACAPAPEPSELASVIAPGAAAGQNFLMITLDTTRADHLGCYGNSEAATPTLDALAASGVLFTQAITPAPVTLPSHASMFTGLVPPTHGIRDNAEYRLAEDHVTLAELFQDQGYETAAFTSAFVLDRRYGLNQGFDIYNDELDATGQTLKGFIVERSAEETTSVVADWMSTRNKDRPFFAWVHYFSPHEPYRPPAPFDEQFRDNRYAGEVAYMDSQIAELFAAMSREGYAETTQILVVADHGEGLGEHGERSHGIFVYDSVMRIPLILGSLGTPPEQPLQIDFQVSIIDILPTIVDLFALEDPAEREGLSLLAVNPPFDRAIYLESAAPYTQNGWAPLFALRRDDDKYIEAPRPEYYSLDYDPAELNNLIETAPSEIAEAHRELAGELDRRLSTWPTLAEVQANALPVDAEALAKLQALGYIGQGAPDPDHDTGNLADPKDMLPALDHLNRATSLMAAGRLREAAEAVDVAADISPRDRRVLHTQGTIHLLLGNENQAERSFLKFNEIKPAADVCALLAQVYVRNGRLDEATQLLDRAEAMDPLHGVTYLVRGDLLSMRGKFAEAIPQYERAGQVDESLLSSANKSIESMRRRLAQP